MQSIPRLFVAALLSLSAAAFSQEAYPSRPIKFIVPLGPGSVTDSVARIIGEALASEVRASIVVENRVGAGGTIGAEAVGRARPDGYTLGIFHSSVLTAAAAVNPSLHYDPRKDFIAIGSVASNPIVLVTAQDSKFKDLDQFMNSVKQNPGTHSAAFIGVGSHSQFSLELPNLSSGARILPVPYPAGGGGCLNAIIGGEVDTGSALWASFAAQVAGGKIRLLATSSPLKEFPQVPTFSSKGHQRAELEVLMAVVGPAGLLASVVAKITPALQKVVADPKVGARLTGLGFIVSFGDGAALRTRIDDEIKLLKDVAERAGIHPE